MIEIRGKFFETNSSSSSEFYTEKYDGDDLPSSATGLERISIFFNFAEGTSEAEIKNILESIKTSIEDQDEFGEKIFEICEKGLTVEEIEDITDIEIEGTVLTIWFKLYYPVEWWGSYNPAYESKPSSYDWEVAGDGFFSDANYREAEAKQKQVTTELIDCISAQYKQITGAAKLTVFRKGELELNS